MPVYKGWKAKLFLDGIEIGYVENWRLEIEENSETYFEAGARFPSTIIPGERLLQGSFKKAWVNSYYFNLLNSSSTFELDLEVDKMGILVENCKLSKGSFIGGQGGIITEDFQFIAKSITPYYFSGQMFKNNSFETGDFSYWSKSGTWEIGDLGKDGSKCAVGFGTSSIEQNFEDIYGVPIPVNFINELYFYARICAETSYMKWVATYSDGSSTTKEFTLYNDWTKYNVRPHLVEGKKLSKFKVWCWHAIGQNCFYLDYFILNC
ncbi:MAG: hypothetical protein DRP01_01850 [Archaeoglobales archaeon]|nr:MAG: hypothetical protein DRP01_01850 [Archaeoglobales archaeon]